MGNCVIKPIIDYNKNGIQLTQMIIYVIIIHMCDCNIGGIHLEEDQKYVNIRLTKDNKDRLESYIVYAVLKTNNRKISLNDAVGFLLDEHEKGRRL